METDIYQLKIGGQAVHIQTGAAAVSGLNEAIDSKMGEAGVGAVSSVNNKTGAVTLTAKDVGAMSEDLGVATPNENGLMAASDKIVIDKMANIEFVKGGEA